MPKIAATEVSICTEVPRGNHHTPGQTTYYRLGTQQGAGDVLQLEYNFNGTNNNGNLLSQRTTRNDNNAYSWEQTFSNYDGANRLVTATETGGWSQSFQYNRWGNMAWRRGAAGPGNFSALARRG